MSEKPPSRMKPLTAVNINKKPAPPISDINQLEPSLQARIRTTYRIAAVWFSFIIGSAGVFYLCKPYMDRKRKEREEMMKTMNSDTGEKPTQLNTT